jgi:hypothetical protein
VNEIFQKPAEFVRLMRDVASDSEAVATAAAGRFAEAVQAPVQQAIFADPLYQDVATVLPQDEIADVVYPKDLIAPGDEAYHAAYRAGRIGAIPERIVEQDFIRVPMELYRDSIELPEMAFRRGSYDVVKRAIQILMEGITMTVNDQVFKTLLTAAFNRADKASAGNTIFVTDPGSGAGTNQLTKTLIEAMKLKIRRAASTNTSAKAFKMSTLFMSPECHSSLVSLNNTVLDEWTRREIVISDDGIVSLLGTKFTQLDEFGTGNKYQKYVADLAAAGSASNAAAINTALTSGNKHLVLGTDSHLGRKDLVILPMANKPSIVEDPAVRRRLLRSWMVDIVFGVGVLDDRVALIGQC